MFDRAIDDARPQRRAGALLSLAAAVVAVFAALALLIPSLARAQTTFGSVGSGAGQLSNPHGVAVDQASGNVYVADAGNRRVDVFASDGTFVKAFGWGVADGASKLETCTTTCQAGLSGSGAGQFDNPTAVAVDQSTHDVYVADLNNLRIEKFDTSGNFILMFGGEVDKTSDENVCTAASGHTCGAGVRGAGDGSFDQWGRFTAFANYYSSFIDVGDSGTVYVGDALRVQKFDASGEFSGALAVPHRGGSTGPQAVLAVAATSNGSVYTVLNDLFFLRKFSASGKVLQTLDSAGQPLALALDEHDDLFVRDPSHGDNVLEYDPAGDQVNSFRVGSGTGTQGGIAYGYSNRDLYVVDSTSDRVTIVSTAPPPGPFIAPASSRAMSVGYTDAILNAIINPEGAAVSYHFEYGLTSSYGQSTRNGSLGAGSSFHKVSAYLSGLAPFTTYHFRIVVDGRSGPDRTFTTYGEPVPQSCSNAVFRYGYGANLPDCRAYEQASPVDKNHSDLNNTGFVAAQDGTAVTFGSYNAFGDAPGSALQLGYVARRSAAGWRTHSLSPAVESQYRSGNTQTYVLGASGHFAKSMVITNAALAPGAVQGSGDTNLYVRDTASGSYRLVAPVPNVPAASLFFFTKFAGAAEDGSRWVFGLFFQKLDSTPAPPQFAFNNLYTWSPTDGLGLVGILPDGTVNPTGAVVAGNNAVAIARHAVSTNAQRIYWTDGSVGGPYPVYLRDANTTKIVSHDESGTAQPATFWYATPDGSRAFITSSSGLTSNASPAGSDLYRYDAGSGELTDLTPDGTDANGADVAGVFGTSNDGSYVYFLATGALASGATAGEENIYVWHDGETRFVGALASNASDITDSLRTGFLMPWQVSANGRAFTLLFSGAISGPHPQPAQPSDDDAEVYYYAYGDGSLDCASCLRNDGTPSGSAELARVVGSDAVLATMAGSSRVVTDNGQLFFSSPDRLLPTDANTLRDVYEYERAGSGSCGSARTNGGCLSLISDGHSDGDSYLIGTSVSGSDVFFTTYDPLVGQDSDNNSDVYDARIGGGLAGQNPQSSALCGGDACKGALAPSLFSPEPGSVRFTGPGNVRGGAHAAAVFHVRALTRRQRRRLAKGRRIRLRVRVSKAGMVRALVRGRLGRHKKVRTLARRRDRAPRGGAVKVALRLSKPARRYLRHHRRLRISIQVRYAHVGGAQKAHLVLRGRAHRRGHHHRGGRR